MKTKGTAIILAFFLGGLGGHKFYLDQSGQGMLYLLFCWTFIPSFLAFIDLIRFLIMSDDEFNRLYNQQMAPALPYAGNQVGQNVTINLGNDHPLAQQNKPRQNLTAELKELKELHIAGALTDDEFQAQKTRLLTE